MHVVGILGGIASGKSTVTGILQELGAITLDVDKMAHEVLLEPDVKAILRDRWGDEVFAADGEIDRSKIARLVFEQSERGKENLEFLEHTSHPRVTNKLVEALKLLEPTAAVVILDAAVMLKAGWHKYCDSILFIHADRATRLARAADRGWSQDEYDNREANQPRLDKAREYASLVIENGSDLSRTREQVVAFWQSIEEPPAK